MRRSAPSSRVQPPKSKIGGLVFLLGTIAAFLILFTPWESPEERNERITERVMDKVRQAEQAKPGAVGSSSGYVEKLDKPQLMERKREVGGKTLRIKVYTTEPAKFVEEAGKFFKEAQQLLDDVDAGRPNSFFSKVNAAAGKSGTKVSDDMLAILVSMRDMEKVTDGFVSIVQRAYYELWRFDRNDMLIADPQVLETRRKLVGSSFLAIDEKAKTIGISEKGVGIDATPVLGGIVLKYVAQYLEAANIEDYFVFYGSDAISKGVNGDKPWQVALQHPKKALFHYAVVTPNGEAVMIANSFESGFYKEGFRYHPILDPHTGIPVQDTMATAVVGPDPMIAEALAYAAFTAGPDKGLEIVDRVKGYKVVLMDRYGRTKLNLGMQSIIKLGEGKTSDL